MAEDRVLRVKPGNIEGLLALDPAERPQRRSESAAKVKQARRDELYKGRKFRVLGEVHVPRGEVFVTRLGLRGRHGWIIEDVETGEREVVGYTLLARLADDYGAVELTRRPPRNFKDDDA